MSYLITGGTGFLGSHVIKELLDRQQPVVVYDIVPNKSTLALVLGPIANELPVVQGDVTNLTDLLNAVKEYRVTHIVHLAAVLAVECEHNPPMGVGVNVGGMVNVLEACRLEHIHRLVWASSASVMGGHVSAKGGAAANDAPHLPLHLYGATKSFCEQLAEHYHRAFGVECVGLRFGLMSGAGKRPGGASGRISTELIEKPALGVPSTVPWGDDWVSWMHVGDAARAVVMALEGPKTRALAFNTMGDYRQISEAAAYVRRLLPEAKMRVLGGKYGFTPPIDASATEAELGFRIRWSMEKQLLEGINAVRRHHGLPVVAEPETAGDAAHKQAPEKGGSEFGSR